MNDENNYLTKTEKSLLQRIGSFFSRNPREFRIRDSFLGDYFLSKSNFF